MTIVDSFGSNIGSFAWSSLGNALFIFIIFFIVLFAVGMLTFFIWFKSYNTKVFIFQPMGQIKFNEDELKQINDDIQAGKVPKAFEHIKFDFLKRKKTHGKDITQRGTSYFALMMPLKKIKPVPLNFRYNDGIYLIQLSRDIFIPIPRPSFIISVSQNVNISVSEQQEWISWSNMMADRINAKYQNPDAEKKQVLYFVIGIVAMVIIGGLILWLIYSSAKKGLDVEAMANSLSQAFAKNVPAAAPK